MTDNIELVKHLESMPFRTFIVSLLNRIYHWHSEMEVILVLEGSIKIDLPDKAIILNQYDIMLLNCNEVHGFSSNGSHNYVLILQIDPRFCKRYYPQLAQTVFTDPCFRFQEDQSRSVPLIQSLAKLLLCFYQKPERYPLKLMAMLYDLVCFLLDHTSTVIVGDNPTRIKSRRINRINDIILYMKENHMRKLTLQEIASRQKVSTYYLSHFFHQATGIAFTDYLTLIRLEKAAKLLATTNLNLLEICLESGFSDYRYLNRAFARTYACTPLEFRKRSKDAGETDRVDFDASQETILSMDAALPVIQRFLAEFGRRITDRQAEH